MNEKIREYEADGVTVRYSVRRCIHAEECVHGLPAVFDASRRPWIDPAQAPPDAIAEVVWRCPTGALHAVRKDGGAEEPIPPTNTIRVAPDGPLYVHGDVEIAADDGTVLLHDTRVALCRCGASKNKPFCDNSHRAAAFEDAGRLRDVKVKPAADGASGALRVTLSTNGPLLLEGPLTLRAAAGEAAEGGRTALCRCGQSANKPFCDGSHTRAGFEAA